MARKIAIFLILSVFAFSAFGEEPVNIPDPNLKSVIENILEISDPNAEDMLNLEYITLTTQDDCVITDLTGLEYAVNLKQIFISKSCSQISNISPLTGLTKITNLQFPGSKISDISPISGLINLEFINLSSNLISDFPYLSGLNKLKILSMDDNLISNVSPLADLTNIEYISIHRNNISDISGLSGLTTLTDLYLERNSISDVSPLAGLVNLERVILGGNPIEDISSLMNLNKLKLLSLSSNPLNMDAYNIYLPLLIGKGISVGFTMPSVKGVSSTDGIYEDRIEISWNTFEGDTFETYYKVFRASSSSGTKTELSDWQTSNSFVDTTATPGITYYYYIKQKFVYEDGAYLESGYGSSETGFIREQFDLTISSTNGGTVTAPGIGVFIFDKSAVVQVLAEVTDPNYIFAGWFGTAVNAGKVANKNSMNTTVTMNSGYTLDAVFIRDSNTIFVDCNATGLNDGSSWKNACNYLQDALTLARYAKIPITIFVAQGTYTPDTGNEVILGDRDAVFQLINNVTLKGGYAGNGEPDPDARDFTQYQTILSGDLACDDISISDPCDLLNEQSRAENSYNVVNGSDVNESAVLDGFIITAGNANVLSDNSHEKGGGMYSYKGSPILSNCVFIRNSASKKGGGIYINNCYSLMENCSFLENSSLEGAGIYSFVSDLTIKRNVFKKNFAYDGAGFYSVDCEPVLTNCLFIDNIAENNGGGCYSFSSSTPLLENCTLYGNSAKQGGGIYIHSRSNSTITNTILWHNIPDQIKGSTNITFSDIQSGWQGQGNIESDPCFVNPDQEDYRLKSSAGRWDSENKIWIQDNMTSLCIDAGDPNSDWCEELWPHGKRINMGAYGGTSQASMSLSEIGDCRDLNNDDLITWEDVLLLDEKWNSCEVPLKEDLDLDGVVDINDLAFYVDWSTDTSNTSPVFDSIEDQHNIKGSQLSFDVSAFDNDGDELVFMALGLPKGAEISSRNFTWTSEQGGTYLVTFIVSDYKSLDYMTVKIIVEEE